MSRARERRARASVLRPARRLGVLLVVAVLLAVSLLLLSFVQLETGGLGTRTVLVWAGLAVTFALAEIFVLHIQVKREAQTLALSEIPLVLGLTLAPSAQLISGLLAGAAFAYVVHRRQRGLKLAYNLSLKAADAVVATVIYANILGDEPILGLRWMVACYVAVAAVSLLDAATTQVVIGLHELSLSPRTILGDIAVYPVLALAVATTAMVAAFAYDRSPLSAVPAAASVACLLVGYRAYSKLSERHLSLERLYRFSQAVTSTPEVNETLGNVLNQAKELLRSEHAEIVFFSGEQRNVVRVAMSPSGRLLRESVVADDRDPTIPSSAGTVNPLMMPRNTREPQARAHLAARRWREAIVVPLHGDAGVIGTLSVADRMGDVRTFDGSDMRLLETVANHAGVALQNSRLIDQLRHESLHDALTSLPNRVLLQRNAMEQLDSCARGDSPGCAIMIMDLDGFKEINDTLGHQHGDDLLKAVATRTADTVGPGVTVARLGGDEFALLVPDCPDGATATAVASAVLSALRHPTDLDGIPVQIGASIGVALAPAHARDVSGLLKHADIAMYAAKASGGGARVYEAHSDTSSPARLALVMDLRSALDNDDLSIHVQPKADLATGDVASVEVLARWEHPRHGVLLPDEFIPLAERTGLMRQLTLHVLRMALGHCAQWSRNGRPVNMAVNLSARSLTDVGLCEEVDYLLTAHAVPAHLLTLEITESTLMADPDEAIRSLCRLRALGVRLSVDDFGVGYSSLSSLSRLPVQELKIDRSFVRGMADSVDDALIVRSIVDLGRNLALDVVAEGVESEQAWHQLRSMGCHFAQGYYVARPMPPAQLEGWLANWQRTRRETDDAPVFAPVTWS